MSAVMKKNNVTVWTVAALLMTGCFHDVHEFRPSEFGDVPVGYYTATLGTDQIDPTTTIDDITLAAVGNGMAISKHFTNMQDMADELLQLPQGEYDILAAVNMTQANGYKIEGLPDTKAAAGSDITVSLTDPASSPAQVWAGCTHADIREDKIAPIDLELQPILATLTVNINNMPAGTTVTMSISDVADKVILNAKDASGRYGKPDTKSSALVTTQSSTIRLMPTISGQERCVLTLELVSAQGTTFLTQCDAPRLDTGKSYTLDLEYSTLRPYMSLSSTSINPWSDGWTVQGEIFNPQN